jgi:exosortase
MRAAKQDPAEGPATTARLRDRVSLWVAAALLLLVYAPTVRWLWHRWTMGVWYNGHGLFIPMVVAWAAWGALKPYRERPPASSAWGFAFLLPALTLHALDTGIHTELLSAASIVLAAPGLSLLFLGVERTKAIAFPLALLPFMLPIPLAFTERLHLGLRRLATWAISQIVPALGIPVYAEGTTVHVSNGVLEIADACSGFSTLYAALAVAVLTAYACQDWRRRLLVLGTAAPIAILANWTRVALLVVLVEWRGLDVLDTWVHVASGLLTFAMALPVIFWLGAPGSAANRGAA